MDKQEALKILIEHTFLFEKDVQDKLIAGIPQMPPEDIEALGKLLASIKKESVNSYDADMEKINQMLETVDKQALES